MTHQMPVRNLIYAKLSIASWAQPRFLTIALWLHFHNLAQTTETAQHSYCWKHWQVSVMRSTGRLHNAKRTPRFSQNGSLLPTRGKAGKLTHKEAYCCSLSEQKQLGLWPVACCPTANNLSPLLLDTLSYIANLYTVAEHTNIASLSL